MGKEFNFFEGPDAEEKINPEKENNNVEPLQIDEKTGHVLTPQETEEEKRRKKENPDWWREQE